MEDNCFRRFLALLGNGFLHSSQVKARLPLLQPQCTQTKQPLFRTRLNILLHCQLAVLAVVLNCLGAVGNYTTAMTTPNINQSYFSAAHVNLVHNNITYRDLDWLSARDLKVVT